LALIPEDKIAEIRDRTDIVQVIGEYVSLKRAGANHKGLCPFHNEKSPSFNVNATKQFFHCFGCGKSGDVITFLREVEGRSFADVARDLAKKAGIDLPEPPRSREEVERARANESERARMVRLNKIVAEYYRNQLADSPAAAKARAYVESRGIGTEVAEKFSLGYAPAGFDALVKYLEGKRVPHELAERAGLIRRRQKDEVAAQLPSGAPPNRQTHFDVFVDRVVYALTSPMGEEIGFGGRILEKSDDQPKYKNSPETLVYKKGENLFGLHVAKHAIRKTGRALVVEGNFDVMTLHQVGVDYTVAPQGTAITAQQVSLLKRFARDVVLMLDADPAGRAATLKVVHLFVEAELPCRIAQLRAKDGKKVDPDDLARNDLPRLQALIDGAVDAVEFFFDQVAMTSEPTVPGRVRAIEDCAPLLRFVADPLARDLYIDRLAQLLKVEPGLIKRTMRAAPQNLNVRSVRPTENAAPPVEDAAPPEAAQRPIAPVLAKLLALLAQRATLMDRVTPSLIDQVADPAVKALLATARKLGAFVPRDLVETCPPEIRDAVAKAFLDEEFAGVVDHGKAFDEITGKLMLPSDRASLEEERKQALARNDMARFREVNARLLKLRISGQA